MDSNTPNIALSTNTPSIEFIEECRHQSALASSEDRANDEFMAFLDQALLDIEGF
ncbi:antitoxin MazE-like protein [Polynucleobacter sp. AM-25C3]|jgi:hypothetical protein|uniref:antitoxin MazE-like protein n=1 Tax=Polynucleobacter sp. AM-25C3 TaxID=1855569 RepID=UPI001C0E6BDE|nr:antitoxin MazE-like protein [Polynucleobacter sp. AM-25C3]MBU3601378.1 DUF3018 family protein [Polynucleobacter sp. AM-25C3]